MAGTWPPSRDGVLDTLLARWDEPYRRYHTLQHLRECLALFDAHRALAERPGEVAVALWFHDAIYDTVRHDNEAASADWAARVLHDAGAPAAVVARVDALVLATCHSHQPATPDERLLVDIDLAILGATPARFKEYERLEAPARANLVGAIARLRKPERGRTARLMEVDVSIRPGCRLTIRLARRYTLMSREGTFRGGSR